MTIEIRRGTTVARVMPEMGFNCYSLLIDGFDYLHRDPGFPASSPTHSGTPILFPWPNRIAGARFAWQGAFIELPVTELATGASLHGFASHSAWQVLETGTDHVTGEFLLSRDAAEHTWPGDAGLRVTYRVEPTALIVSAQVFAAGTQPVPYGLGFHPYFRVPGPFDQWLLQCDARASWPLVNMVPTGEVVTVPQRLDFRRARRIGTEHLDDVLTGLPESVGLTRRAALLSMASSLTVSSDPTFGHYVVFTPAARDAVAIEPYTCATDAVHLEQRGIEAGWQVLQPGESRDHMWRVDVQ